MISIIIPVYNQAKKLGIALKSILALEGVEYEVIVVNDGSADDPEKTFTEVLHAADTQSRFIFINQENQGAPAARNRGLREAQGELVFFCDADADLKPHALSRLIAALQAQAGASYVYPSFRWGNKLFKVGPFDPEKLKRGPYIHTMALIRRSDLPAGAWDEKIRKFQDWDLWLTMLENGRYGVWVDEVLFTIATGGTISSWVPSFAYKLLPFLPAVRRYKEAMAIIKQKHGLA